jgi:hypothetical protein
MSALHIEWIGGNCPVQAEGAIGDEAFYFRARGENWSIGVGGDPVGSPRWYLERHYGDWPSAGWMSEDEARAFIQAAAGLLGSGDPGDAIGPPPGQDTKLPNL